MKSSEEMAESGEEVNHLLKTNTWPPEANSVLSDITKNLKILVVTKFVKAAMNL